MIAGRTTIDVSDLPTTTFGHRDLAWWGTIGFILIEGTTLVIVAMVYFYLRRNFAQWPPPRTAPPDLLPGILQVGVMALSWWPVALLDRAARRLDRGAVRRWLVVCTLFAIAFCVLRGFEFAGLNVRWSTNAYGSVNWAVLVTHATLILAEALEIIVITAVFFTPRVTERHFSDASDTAPYWYFLTGSWVLLAAMIYLVPRFWTSP
ncbi:MAG TPA: hypothetical protein VFK09_11985 [Gemmatimonadales bacterium]|nr:hypothetical protein [Gemmatimonadales bacterium]